MEKGFFGMPARIGPFFEAYYQKILLSFVFRE
jgi:hypothetical protein